MVELSPRDLEQIRQNLLISQRWPHYLLLHLKRTLAPKGERVEIGIETVIALWRLQGGRCRLCGREFELPETKKAVKDGWLAWLNSLPPRRAAMAPALVKAWGENGWVPGNLILVASCWAAVYCGAGAVGQTPLDFGLVIQQMMVRVQRREALHIPTAAGLRDAAVAYLMELPEKQDEPR